MAPLHAICKAIIRAANQSTERLKPCFPPKETEQDAIKYQMYVFYEFLYFFMHMTNRCTDNEGLTSKQIEEFQQSVYPDVIAVAIDSFMLHCPEEYKTEITHEFYDNVNSAELEYSTSKELTPKDHPYTGDSLLSKLSRNVAAKLDCPYNPEVLFQVASIAHDELMNSNLNKLVGAAKTVLHS